MQDTYQFSFMVTNKDYVVRDHTLYETRMMPGVVFLDMVFRYIIQKGFDPKEVELKNVIFKEPIATQEEFDRKVSVTIFKEKNYYRLQAKSIEWKAGKTIGNEWHDNFETEIHKSDTPLEKTIDIGKLIQNATVTKDMDVCYEFCRRVGLVHYEFMKLLGKIYIADDYILAEAHLGELAETSRNRFFLHPAFLDGALSVPGALGLGQEGIDTGERKPRIPMFVGSFKACKQLTQKCYVYIDKSNVDLKKIAQTQTKDINYYNIEIFDQTGKLAVFYNKFGVKMVRNQESIHKLLQSEQVKEEHTMVSKNSVEKNEMPKTDMLSIRQHILEIVSGLTGTDVEKIKTDVDYYDLGLDSKDLLQMVQQIEKLIHHKLYPTLLFEYTSIDLLIDYIQNKVLPDDQNREEHITKEQKIMDLSSYFYTPYWKASYIPEADNSFQGNVLIVGDVTCDLVRLLYDEYGYDKIQILGKDVQTEEEIHDFCSHMETPQIMYFIADMNLDVYELDDLDQLNKCEKDGIEKLHLILNALRKNKELRKLLKICIVTDSVFQVCEDDIPKPFSAALYGYARTFSLEYPKIETIILDIRYDEFVHGSFEAQKKTLLALKSLRGEIPLKEKALRGDYIWEKGMARLKMDEKIQTPFRKEGVYVIAGGAGGIGFEISKYLSREFTSKLIWLGQSPINLEKQDKMKEIERLGGNVIYLQADIKNEVEVSSGISKAKEIFGAIHGFIHSAVKLEDGILETMTSQSLMNTVKVKSTGSVVLYKVLKQENLDFLLFFSSTQAVFSNYGQANYAAACTFKDAYANALRKRYGLNAKVINWGYWGQVGIAAKNNQNSSNMEKGGAIAIKIEEGIRMMQSVLMCSASQVIAVKANESVLTASGVEADKILEADHLVEVNHLGETGKEPLHYTVWETKAVGEEKSKNGIDVEKFELLAKEYAPVKILGVGTMDNLDQFRDVWYNMKHGKYTPIGKIIPAIDKRNDDSGPYISHIMLQLPETGNMEVVTAGSGSTILLIDGFGLTSAQWYYQYKEWSTSYKLITIHIPGIGLSDGNGDVSVEAIAESFIHILNFLHVDKFSIVTSSWGGMVGQMLAAKYKERVSALVISGGFCSFDSNVVRFRDVIKRDFENIHASEYYELITKSEYLNPVSMQYPSIFTTEDIAEKVQVPTLLIYGDVDMVVEKEKTILLSQKIKGAQVYAIKNSGHVPNITHYSIFNQVAENFILKHI